MKAKQPFEAVVEGHGPTVLRVCRAIVGPIDADDAWSDTFLAAMKAYPDLPADANIEAWLVTVAHRKAIDQAAADAPELVTPGTASAASSRVHVKVRTSVSAPPLTSTESWSVRELPTSPLSAARS